MNTNELKRTDGSRFYNAGVAVIFALLLVTLTVRAQSNLVLFNSAAGDYIGEGQLYVTENPADFSVTGTPAMITVSAFGFSFYFAGPGGTNLAVGSYPNTLRWPFNGSSPGLDISGNGRGCNTECGSFQINELHVDGSGQVDRLWLTYSNRCECFNAPMIGEIRYNSQLAPGIIIITQQPTNQTVFSGNTATINFAAIGIAPMYYNWFLNGTNIAVTTSSQLVIPNFQAVNSGVYGVVVTNSIASATCSNITLSVTDVAPIILTPPANLFAGLHSNATLTVLAVGSLPMTYQWRFNGVSLGQATNATLNFTNLQFSSLGNYDVVLNNAFGSVTSSPVLLTVTDMSDINAALNITNLSWITSGDMPWLVQPNPASGDPWGFGYSSTHDGVKSMQSGNNTAGQQSILQTAINGPATVTFWWQTVSPSFADVLTVSLNGTPQASISYVTSWQQPTIYLGAGTNVLQWNYQTDANPGNKATAWLDQLNVLPGGTPPFVISTQSAPNGFAGSNTTMSVSVSGTPPFNYQWQFNGTNIPAATNAMLTLSNLQLVNEGIYTVIAGNDFGSTNVLIGALNVVDLAEALNGLNLTWTTNGNALPWFPEGSVNRDGLAAAQSGLTTNGQTSGLQTVVAGPGLLTFWWNVDSYSPTDYLGFFINGSEQSRISGSTGWQQKNIYLGTGQQTLQWNYLKTDDNVSGQDAGWLEQVGFFPGATPPFIVLNPTGQIVLLGSNVTLNAAAQGTPPISYQWQLNGTNVPDATNATLTLNNAQFANEGNYVLLATSPFGATNTLPVLVNVVDFTESLNATNLVWSSSGNKPWFPETTITHDGIAALQSGAITASQQSTVSNAVSGPGTLSFWWKVSCETNNDYLNFTVDGVEQARNSGLLNQWQQKTFYLTNGTHLLAWNYTKNATINSGTDTAWLDQVSYIPGGTAAFAASGPADQIVPIGSNATFTVTAAGTPPISYQWRFNDSPILGATNGALTITNVQVTNSGNYSVSLANDYGGTTSSNAFLYLLNVYAWGAGRSNTFISANYGQSIVPTNLVGVKAIAGGGYHSMALRSDGRVVAWGYNNYGETNTQSTLTNAAAISAGLYHSLALRSNGTVTVWGNSSFSITTVPTAATNVAAIAAGWYHCLALRSNGTVVAWGAGTFQSSSPYFGQSMVPTNLSGVMAIAAGGYHSLALRTNGTVVAWGLNTSGQTNVPAGLNNIVAIAAGASNSLALKNDGSLVAWGFNGNGQTNVPAYATNVVAISCGAAHNLALLNDGSLISWGLNANSQTNVPVDVTNIVAIAAGGYHSLALANVGPVTFLNPPYSQAIFKGSNAVFNPAVLGLAPIAFQWQQNGANVPNATNATLQITNAQFSDAGNYRLVASNSFGAVASASATLTVNDTAPFFTTQPTNVTVMQNSSFALSSSVGGLPPFFYQWRLNDLPIAAATNLVLTVTNAQLTNEGNYSLLVSNASGTAISSNAYADVVDLPQALGLTNVFWFNPGTPAWFTESTNTHDGFAAAVGPLAYGKSSSLQTSVTGPGTLSFWWCGLQYASMTFQLDGAIKASQQFPTGLGWLKYTFYLGSGIHALNWTAANQTSSFYNSVGLLDQVSFTPGTAPVSISTQPVSQTNAAGNSVTFSVGTIGTPPITYQWYFNSVAISGATGSSFTVNSIQAGDTGSYCVTVNNGYGMATSSNAVLTVTPSAPVITTQPAGVTLLLGSTITFSSGANGTSPINFQWLFNGALISGATNTSLTLTNIQYADGGGYSLQASNVIGVVTSSVAMLSPYSVADLGATLDNPAFTWSTTNVPWFPQTNTTHDGVSAAQSGTISGTQQSTLQGVVTGPATVTYWWKVSCDSFWVNLAFVQNGTVQNAIAGTVDWVQATNYIGAGTSVLQWNLYPIHNAFAGGTGWVDQVQIIPGGTPVSLVSNPASSTNNAGNNVMLAVAAIGTPPLLYQWQFNGSDLPGATNASLVLNNLQTNNAGVYSVSVTNDFGFAVSSNATLVVNPVAPIITTQPVSVTKVVHSTATFSVSAKGSNPLAYQWFFNATPVAGATTNFLTVTNVQFTNSGNYSVVITNVVGAVTSTNAYLDVEPVLVMEFWPYGTSGYSAPAGLGNLTAIAAGALHTLALRSDGSVVAWGNNSYGQTNVPAGLSNVIAIAAGDYHSLALKADGTVTAWGDNSYGQLNPPAGLSNVVAIAAGPSHNLALKNDGIVIGWGNDNNGQIDIPTNLTNARAIGVSGYSGFAILTDGTTVQWGSSPVWQHNGTNTTLQVGAGMSNTVAVAAGSFTGWAMQDDSYVLAYGWFDGVAPFTNSYSSSSSWNGSSRSRNIYGGIVALSAYGVSSPFYDYALLLDGNGQITQVGSQGGLGAIGGSVVPYISTTPSSPFFPISPGNVFAVAAGYSHATALIGDGSPRIVRLPENKLAYSGDTVTFAPGIIAPSGAYQWQFNGTNLDGATNALLVLTNVPLTATGAYRCLATNTLGAVTNLDATLTVLRSLPRFNSAGLTLTNGSFAWQLDRLSGHGNIVIYASTNLMNWIPIFTNPPQIGSLMIIDPDATNIPARYYRAQEF